MPANDNFANAIILAANPTGYVSGNNIGATVEAGEPGKLQFDPSSIYPAPPAVAAEHTVWWSWTCPLAGAYLFETRGNDGTHWTDFKSVIQAFTGDPTTPIVSGLTETPYLLNQSVGLGNGYEYAALNYFPVSCFILRR